jgi:GWxTD domain-containing protein
MRHIRFLVILMFLSLGLSAVHPASSAPADKSKNKGGGDQVQYYKKWLEEDVLYIISDEEKNVFKSLKNDEERESFIEDFWQRRNPDPRSPYNTFKEEHYRRIAYANQHFASGIPGWKTDRGRIYIMYGKPDELESHPTGGAYDRPYYEGGGTTTTFPFEKWWYRHIDGIGDDIEIEFVDKSMSGEYRMAMSPDEKDALLNVPNAGLTLAEEMGLADKADRLTGLTTDPNSPYGNYMRAKDSPFSRMEQYFSLQRPPQIKFDDLKSIVTTNITYNTLPYDVRTDYIRLSEDRVLVPISIELNNKELEFRKETDFNRAKVNVYGIITSLTNRIMAEWEDEIVSDFSDESFERGKNKRSEYQRIVSLPPGQRYKLELVLKDSNNKNTGTLSVGLNVPKYPEDGGLQSSSIILANSISEAPMSINQLEQFIIGDMKIIPNVTAEYLPDQNLIAYLQIYNMQIDQTNQKPSLDVSFLLKNKDKVVAEYKGTPQNSQQFFYGLRVVLLGKIPVKGLAPGNYVMEIKVQDNIANRTISTSTDFKVKEQVPAISAVKP